MPGINVYVVSYDIMEQRRLQRMHRTMKGFGEPLHYSVFRCDLSKGGREEMIAAISRVINHKRDRVMIIDLGPADGRVMERIEFIGVHRRELRREAIIV